MKMTTLQARLDVESKDIIVKAAKLRRVGISDYVRMVLVSEAQKEVNCNKNNTIQMTADEQETFWNALNVEPDLTESQKKLSKIMKGK